MIRGFVIGWKVERNYAGGSVVHFDFCTTFFLTKPKAKETRKGMNKKEMINAKVVSVQEKETRNYDIHPRKARIIKTNIILMVMKESDW